jgi:type III pantothenate kinase
MTDSTILAVDVGNTNVHIGLFLGDALDAVWSLQTDTARERDDYAVSLTVLFQRHGLVPREVEHAILGSVVPPLTSVFEQLLSDLCSLTPLVVRSGTRTGIRLSYDPLFELGADRIAHAVAVNRLYGSPAIVVDFGTATSFDAIGPQGAYLGGAIAPGLGIAADALWQRTAQLHRIDLRLPEHAVGRNTVEAVQSGLIYGHVGMTREMIRRIREEIGDSASVIATGQHADLIAPHVSEIEVVDCNLALHGLRLIYELNQIPQRGSEKLADD